MATSQSRKMQQHAGPNVLLTGGGTLGPVTPLLALVPGLRKAGAQLFFAGTPDGPEKALVNAMDIPFWSIPAPRFRRFVTWRHVLMPFEMIRSLLQARRLLRDWKPQVIVSAGGFVSVPVVWMASARNIPSVIHQQDVRPGLANKLMERFAHSITVSFPSSVDDFHGRAVEWVGNPVRDLAPTTQEFKLDKKFPTILVFGGGTGAQALNELVRAEWCDRANVIHITGEGKVAHPIQHPRYHKFQLLGEEMKEALKKADIVVCRAGLGTISELAALKKPAIIIPLPKSHQEDNAAWLKKNHAAVVLRQEEVTAENILQQIEILIKDQHLRIQLGEHIGELYRPDAADRLVEIILELVQRRR